MAHQGNINVNITLALPGLYIIHMPDWWAQSPQAPAPSPLRATPVGTSAFAPAPSYHPAAAPAPAYAAFAHAPNAPALWLPLPVLPAAAPAPAAADPAPGATTSTGLPTFVAPIPTAVRAAPAFLTDRLPPSVPFEAPPESPILYAGASPVTFATVPPSGAPRSPPPASALSTVVAPTAPSPASAMSGAVWVGDVPLMPLTPAPRPQARPRRGSSCPPPSPSPIPPPMSPFGGEPFDSGLMPNAVPSWCIINGAPRAPSFRQSASRTVPTTAAASTAKYPPHQHPMRCNSTEPSWKREARKRKQREETAKRWGAPASEWVWKNGGIAWDPDRAALLRKKRGMASERRAFGGPQRAPAGPPSVTTQMVRNAIAAVSGWNGWNGEPWGVSGWGNGGEGDAWGGSGWDGWNDGAWGGGSAAVDESSSSESG
ncbi:hypothetical protein FA95DRAFT_1577687 [Auriscalpium vulgare]|uniref:Uncharacterized protein n=1 Tax=Auriscalpium vulgare TaxID=40419 RepID=A0ACB8R5H9_9AGAM|nr:hypothetical protein FA95DRAFT_1577687 [Auriscalpium vulgare]